MSDPQSPVDDLGLSGKAAIVTGGGAPDDGIGNGRAAAILLARAGAHVLVVDIVPEAADQTVAMKTAEIARQPLEGLDEKLAQATKDSDKFYKQRSII